MTNTIYGVGTVYGSVNNAADDGVVIDGKIEIGMGATMLSWSDRHPATIIDFEADEKGLKMVKVQEDSWKRTDGGGMSDCQDYEYSRNPDGATHTYKRARNGRLTNNGTNSGTGIVIGHRERYYDFSF